MVCQGGETAVDFDSIRIAVRIDSLRDFFNDGTLSRLLLIKGITAALRQFVLVADVGGYNFYAKLNSMEKYHSIS